MSKDYLHYESLVEDALRDVMRKAMDIVARDGLVGDHYFHITFRTDHPGVDIPANLRREYPEEMPIVLQNAFWDLEVGELGFAVSLSFNRTQQRMTIPFDAITIFQDPPANFRLQFQADEDGEGEGEGEGEAPDEAAESAAEPGQEPPDVAGADTPKAGDGDAGDDAAGDTESGNAKAGESGGKVVTLDAFRNK